MHLVRVSRTTFHIEVILLAGLLVFVGVLATYALQPAPVRVDITSVTWSAGGTQLSTGPGWDTVAGSQATLKLTVTNFDGPMDFTTATLGESGFRVIGTSLPMIAEGATANLTVTVAVPNSAYTGPLNIELA